jgi:hypothetical protein
MAAACRIGLHQGQGAGPPGRRSVPSSLLRGLASQPRARLCLLSTIPGYCQLLRWLSPRLLTKLLTNRFDLERSSRYSGGRSLRSAQL